MMVEILGLQKSLRRSSKMRIEILTIDSDSCPFHLHLVRPVGDRSEPDVSDRGQGDTRHESLPTSRFTLCSYRSEVSETCIVTIISSYVIDPIPYEKQRFKRL